MKEQFIKELPAHKKILLTPTTKETQIQKHTQKNN